MKFVLTGATGFLGANLLRELLKEGHQVSCIIRQPNDVIKGLDAQLHTLPLEDNPKSVNALAKVLDGADGVFHLAGIFDPSPKGLDLMTQLHIFGTRALLRATELAKVPKFVHCSSSITVGFGDKSNLGNENTPLNPVQIYGAKGALRHYYNSKIQSEHLVLGWEGLHRVVVNPDYILGPYDVKPTSGQMIVTMAKHGIPVYPKGGKCFLGAEDCAKAHLAAMLKGRSGERYLLGYHNLSYQEFLNKVAKIVGKKSPLLPIPNLGTRILGNIGKVANQVDAHRFAGLDANVLKSMQEERYRSGAKMCEELGISPQEIEVDIEKAYRWFCDNGYC